jgi:hypothetical protein
MVRMQVGASLLKVNWVVDIAVHQVRWLTLLISLDVSYGKKSCYYRRVESNARRG